MRIPELCILKHDGTEMPLFSLAVGRPVALVFLRHLGCIFCREQVATLRDAMPDENIAFVTMAEPRLAARFRTWIRSPHLFICDSDRKLYHEFGLERGNFNQVVIPHISTRGFSALRKGYFPGRLSEDRWQLGGTFVMDGEGCVSASFPASDAGDHPSPESLKKALLSAA
jgi:hypothetical protein